ncbi:MAG: hypothetical protein Q9182_002403 [Xanthomendoza sp. 2 TL-2023]
MPVVFSRLANYLHAAVRKYNIQILATALCAPVGGIGPSVTSARSSLLATSQLQIPTTATYAASVTGVDQASSVLATATPAPNRGNPAGGDPYPECAVNCADLSAGGLSDPNDLSQVCGVQYRTRTAICEAAICSDLDRQNTQLLAQQLCRPFYQNNPALGSSVVASIASATPLAQAATKGKNPADQSNWPQCAQSCQNKYNLGGCGTLSNTTCICGNPTVNQQIGGCELSTCPPDDLTSKRFAFF